MDGAALYLFNTSKPKNIELQNFEGYIHFIWYFFLKLTEYSIRCSMFNVRR